MAERYECLIDGSCSYVEDLYVANNVDLTIAPTQRYRLDPTSGYILRVMSAVSSRVALLTTMSGSGQITCRNLCAQPPTPTPTNTPTNTPTVTPTPTSTPLPTYYVASMCGTGTEYVVTGDIIPSINGVYKIYDPTCYGGFDGNICWQIVRTQSGGNIDCENVVFGTNYGSCVGCVPTPTPTSTPTPTPTETPTPPPYDPNVSVYESCDTGDWYYSTILSSFKAQDDSLNCYYRIAYQIPLSEAQTTYVPLTDATFSLIGSNCGCN